MYSNISEEEYTFLAKKGLGTHCFCKKCDEAAIDGLKMMQTLQDKTRCIEEKVDRLEIGVKKIETVQCPELEKRIRNIAREEAHEATGREKKQKNVIISDIPEVTTQSDAEEQIKRDMELPNCENDIEIINCIIKQIGIDADIVQQAFRVPRERQKDSPPRKIVVSLTTRYDKFKVLEKASSLRERGNKWKNVYINSDKTQKEQEQDYRLRQERRRRLENGEKDLIIYKGEITTKQALQQETGTEVSDIQPQTRNQ